MNLWISCPEANPPRRRLGERYPPSGEFALFRNTSFGAEPDNRGAPRAVQMAAVIFEDRIARVRLCSCV